eukprot:m.94635 g.94635  ORF g.94635 m.94635 type:complete len:586 (+) comp26741_c0_seq1:139-1896(+)
MSHFSSFKQMMDDDDSLGDLADVMGSDYNHGGDFDAGDPNIKPRTPAAPEKNIKKKVKHGTIHVKFPAQKQWLTKLVVQCLPCKFITEDKKNNPFALFTSANGYIVQPKDPGTATTAKFDKLPDGGQYIFRLVATNPSGTVYGHHSASIFTLPKVPPAPEFGYASAKSVSIKFPPQGLGITKLSIEMAVFCADPFGPDNKKKGMLTDTSKHIVTRTSGLVKNLKPGVQYVFRLVISNPAGSVTGSQSMPIKTLPKKPFAPREETTGRTDSTIQLKWAPLGHEISKLVLQYAVLSGKDTFENVKKNGGRDITLSNPQDINGYTIKSLKASTNYVMRLIAYNSSGKSTGEICGPIKTVTFAPDMLDHSGWLYEIPSGKGAKPAKGKRKMSFRKAETPKYWYTIDGKLLSWAATVGGEEINYLHLGKTKAVQVQEADIILPLKDTAKTKTQSALCLRAFSDDPNIDDKGIAKKWGEALHHARTGEKAVEAEMKAAAMVQAVAIDGDDLDAIDRDVAEEAEDDEDGGFEEDEDFGGGFGDDDDEDDEDDGGGGFGGGGFDEDEDDEEDEDDTGFGEVDEDEEEEASGFD